MAVIPSILRLSSAGVEGEARKAVDAVAPSLNAFMTPVTNALSKGLTFGENLDSQIHTVKKEVPVKGGQIVAIAKRTTTQAIADGATVIIDFATLDSDVDATVTTGAAWKFTAPRAMTVLVSSALHLTDVGGATGYLDLRVYKNGSMAASLQLLSGPWAVGTSPAGTKVLELAKSDTVDIRLFQSTAGTRNCIADGTYNYVSITEIDRGNRTPNPPSCWPYDFVCTTKGKPKGVEIWSAEDAQDATRPVAAGLPSWVVFEKEGKRFIRVKHVPGLVGGRTYNLTFVVHGG